MPSRPYSNGGRQQQERYPPPPRSFTARGGSGHAQQNGNPYEDEDFGIVATDFADL